MSYTSNVQIAVTKTGSGTNKTAYYAPPPANASCPSDGTIPWTLVTGFNTYNIPAGATGFGIKPPSGNAIALTVKGANGDAGWSMNPAVAFWFPIGPGMTQVGITAGGSLTIELEFT